MPWPFSQLVFCSISRSPPVLPCQLPCQAVRQPLHRIECCEVPHSPLLQVCQYCKCTSSGASARPAPSASANVSGSTTACSVSRHLQCPVCRSFPRPLHRQIFRKCGWLLPLLLWQPVCELVPCPAHAHVSLTSAASIFATMSAGVSTTSLACILTDVLLSVFPEPLLPRVSISILTSFSLGL